MFIGRLRAILTNLEGLALNSEHGFRLVVTPTTYPVVST